MTIWIDFDEKIENPWFRGSHLIWNDPNAIIRALIYQDPPPSSKVCFLDKHVWRTEAGLSVEQGSIKFILIFKKIYWLKLYRIVSESICKISMSNYFNISMFRLETLFLSLLGWKVMVSLIEKL